MEGAGCRVLDRRVRGERQHREHRNTQLEENRGQRQGLVAPQHTAGNRCEVQRRQQQSQTTSLRRAAQRAPQQEQVHRRINCYKTHQHGAGNGEQHVAIHLIEEVQQLNVVAGAFLQQLGTKSRAAERQNDAVDNVGEGHGDEHTRTNQ